MPPSPDYHPLTRVQGKVRQDDFDLLVRELSGGLRGFQNELIYHLVHAFATFTKTRQLKPYADDHTTPDKLLRYLEHGRWTIGDADTFIGLPRRTDDSVDPCAVP